MYCCSRIHEARAAGRQPPAIVVNKLTLGNIVVNKLTRNVDSLTADLFYFSRYFT
jgi:hypothetical protein